MTLESLIWGYLWALSYFYFTDDGCNNLKKKRKSASWYHVPHFVFCSNFPCIPLLIFSSLKPQRTCELTGELNPEQTHFQTVLVCVWIWAPALALTMAKLSLHQIKAPFSTLIRVQLDLQAAECWLLSLIQPPAGMLTRTFIMHSATQPLYVLLCFVFPLYKKKYKKNWSLKNIYLISDMTSFRYISGN